LTQELPRRLQGKFQEAVDDAIFKRLRAGVPGNSRDRLDATRRKHAGAWASAFPNKSLGLWLPNREFSATARSWLGVLSQSESRAMLRPGLAMQGRHHAVQESLMTLCKSAGVPARKEVLIDSASSQRPADVYLPHWSRGISYAVDVTVSHPSQALHTIRDGVAPVESSSASVRAAEAKVALKTAKYSAQCDAHGVTFVAAAICCYGGWLDDAEKIVVELAERAAVRSGVELSVLKGQFWQRLSIALWKGNARQILHYSW
jgi:hypothetical protein